MRPTVGRNVKTFRFGRPSVLSFGVRGYDAAAGSGQPSTKMSSASSPSGFPAY